MPLRSFFVLCLLAGSLAIQAAEIYRWTDAEGRVHFGQRPETGAEPIEVRPQVVERDAVTREREARAERYFGARRGERQAEARRQAERQAQHARECEALRERLARLSRGGRYYHVDERGGRVYYSDEELAAARRQLSGLIEQRCG